VNKQRIIFKYENVVPTVILRNTKTFNVAFGTPNRAVLVIPDGRKTRNWRKGEILRVSLMELSELFFK
jgi:hypothetical protein